MKTTVAVLLIVALFLCWSPAALGQELPGLFVEDAWSQWSFGNDAPVVEDWQGQLPEWFCCFDSLEQTDLPSDSASCVEASQP